MFEQKSDKPTKLDHLIMGTGATPLRPDGFRDRIAGRLGIAFVTAIAAVSRVCPSCVRRTHDAILGKDFH